MKKSKLQRHAGSQKSPAPCLSTPIKRRFFSPFHSQPQWFGLHTSLYIVPSCQLSITGRKERHNREKRTWILKRLCKCHCVQRRSCSRHLHSQVPTAVHNTHVLRLHASYPTTVLLWLFISAWRACNTWQRDSPHSRNAHVWPLSARHDYCAAMDEHKRHI